MEQGTGALDVRYGMDVRYRMVVRYRKAHVGSVTQRLH